MAPVALPDLPPSDGVVALRGSGPGGIDVLVAALQDPEIPRRAGFAPVDAPLLPRPECDHLPDVFFARLRGA